MCSPLDLLINFSQALQLPGGFLSRPLAIKQSFSLLHWCALLPVTGSPLGQSDQSFCCCSCCYHYRHPGSAALGQEFASRARLGKMKQGISFTLSVFQSIAPPSPRTRKEGFSWPCLLSLLGLKLPCI